MRKIKFPSIKSRKASRESSRWSHSVPVFRRESSLNAGISNSGPLRKNAISKFPNQMFARFKRKNKGRLSFKNIRSFFWNYPDKLFPSVENLIFKFKNNYKNSRPIGPLIFVLLFLSLAVVVIYYLEFSYKSAPRQQFVEGLLGIPDKINPIYIPQLQVEKDINELVFNSLFEIQKDGAAVGELTESWEFRDDGKELNLKLRPGITWQDGTRFTSSDVAFTINLYKGMQGQDSYFNTVENVEIEVISEFEILLKMDRPMASFLETITWPILPEHKLNGLSVSELEKINFSDIPGTGPFIFSRKKENEIILAGNEGYWKGMPVLEKLVFRAYPKENDLINALLAGRIDATPELSPLNLGSIQDIKWIRHINIPLLRRYWAVYLNFNGPEVIKDKRVRQALSSAVNRERIIDEILSDSAIEAAGPIQKDSWAYNEDVKRYGYNVADASKLFSEAGFAVPENEKYLAKDGEILKLELGYVSNPVQDKVAEFIAQDWESVGVQVELNGLPYTEFRDTMLIPRNFETILFGVESLLDPDHLILWHSSQSTPPGRNFASYKSTYSVIESINRVDDLLEKGKMTLDQEQRKDFYNKFQIYLLDEAPAIFLYHPAFIYTFNERVQTSGLEGATLPEERFKDVEKWIIK